MDKQLFKYQDGSTVLEASIAFPPNKHAPVIVVCHAWSGRDAVAQTAIEKIASWGYVGFALDVYGQGIFGKSRDECIALKAPFLKDRHMLNKRLMQGLKAAQEFGNVIAVIGFGFGGLCALDLARSDPSLKGVGSIYGHFEEAEGLKNSSIQAKVLLLHGADDPIVPVKELYAFGDDLIQHKIPLEIHIFENTLHAFMNPLVNNPASGVQYQPTSSEKTWEFVRQFLQGLA